MANKMLEMDLSPEDEKLLRESLESWKESVYSNLLEEVEVLKEKTIQELEEANQEYLSEIKKEYTAKMVKALNEMREDIRSEVFTEMVTSNPELQILEKIKSLVAPTLNEEFNGNVYSEQINNLVEENEALKREMELNEGARTLAGLIKDFDRKTQKLILSVIKEGNADEITEQFYQIAESLELFEEEKGEDGEELPDEEEEHDGEEDTSDAKYHSLTDWKEDGKPEPKKGDFEDDADYKKAKAQWSTDEDEDEKEMEEAYDEWIASEPTRRDFELKEDYEYAHELWEQDEPVFEGTGGINAIGVDEKGAMHTPNNKVQAIRKNETKGTSFVAGKKVNFKDDNNSYGNGEGDNDRDDVDPNNKDPKPSKDTDGEEGNFNDIYKKPVKMKSKKVENEAGDITKTKKSGKATDNYDDEGDDNGDTEDEDEDFKGEEKKSAKGGKQSKEDGSEKTKKGAGDIEESIRYGRKGLRSYINEGTVGRQRNIKKEGTNKDAILKLI
jgi:hypothetical protein